jgi:hypothetical protein
MRVVVLCLVFAIVLAQGANAAEVLEPEALRRNFSAPGIAWLRMDQPTVTGTCHFHWLLLVSPAKNAV